MEKLHSIRSIFSAQNHHAYRLLFAIGSILLYVIFILLLHYLYHFTSMAILSLFPVSVIAWLYGARIGVIAGALSLPFNILMFSIIGINWIKNMMETGSGIAGTLGLMFIALIIGRLSDLGQQLRKELSQRQSIEDELKQHRDKLEKLVNNKTHELQASQERFRAIAEHCPDAIIITDSTGIMRYCNTAAEKMFGYGPEEMLGQPHSILLPQRLRQAELDEMQSHIGAEEVSRLSNPAQTTIALRKDGTEFSVEFPFFAWQIDDEIFFTAIMRDITQRKRIEETLSNERKRLAAIIETSPVIICGITSNGTTSFINKTGEEITGYNNQELTGLNWWATFYPGDLYAQVEELFSRFVQGGDVVNREMTLRTKTGELRTILWNSITSYNSEAELLEVIGFGNDMTERKRADNEARQAHDFLENIFKASPDAIIVTDSYGYIIMANNSVYSVYGYRPEELIGQHVSLFSTYEEAMMQKTFAMMEELYEKGIVQNFIAERRHKDGHIIHTESSVVQMKNPDGTPSGGISSSRDIADRMKSEEQLRQARDYFETIFKASPDAILVTDAVGYIVMANESVYSVYGYHPAEIVGQHAAILTPDNEKAMQAGVELVEQLFENGAVHNHTAERQRKDGTVIQVETSVILLKNPDGTPPGAISSSRDITDRKRLEEQLRQSQKMEAIGTLAGGIAHDFNNILAAIMGYTELSKNLTEGNTVLEKNLSQVLKSVDRAKSLVRQILAFSRKTEGEVKPLHLHLVIEEAFKLLRASLPSTISIHSDINDTDDVVIADATKMHQIIMNLCTNAAYAMQTTGGVLEVTLKPIDLDMHAAGYYVGLAPGPYVHLSFKDSGMGIPRDVIGRIFEPFFTTKGVGKGTGMGLAMVHGIVKNLHGDIKVYSEPGKGAIFHIVLPRAQAEKTKAHMADPKAPQGNESLLLVDDEAALLDVGEQILSSLGYRVTAVSSPVKALELFSKNPEAFDIIITDQTMPQLTGYELAQQLLAIRSDIPVILCTGYSDLVTAESAMAGGIKAFVIKPLNRLAIAETIRKVVD